MTETRLRTWTHATSYGLAAIFTAALGLQNLRYGFYPAFYLAMFMATLLGAGLAYTVICRRQQLSAPGHLVVLLILNAALVLGMLTLQTPGLSHWAMPLALLNLLVLPVRKGLALSALLVATAVIPGLLQSPSVPTLNMAAGSLVLLATTGMYVWHYDHMAQSARDLALTDPVTGANNARFLDENLDKEISRAIATGHPLSVISLNLEHTDEIRALHGTGGLQALRRNVTSQLFDIIRAGDSLYGADEHDNEEATFFLVLPFTPEEGVRVIAERIRRNLSEHDWPNVGKIAVSLGCTTRSSEDTRGVQLRDRARQAMNEARDRGADTVWFLPGDAARG
ncbi:MAG: GGDEF domain-containing protein [Alteromonadaceae bacterium]|nr:GGDEF domain-containing protein [Alteromonadaceae bacterium]